MNTAHRTALAVAALGLTLGLTACTDHHNTGTVTSRYSTKAGAVTTYWLILRTAQGEKKIQPATIGVYWRCDPGKNFPACK